MWRRQRPLRICLWAALALGAARALDICFHGAFTQERCCGPAADEACWDNGPEDWYMRLICCLDLPVDTDPDPPRDFLPTAEEALSCRNVPSWSRFRRLLSTVMKDGTLITHDSRMMALLTAHAYSMVWRKDGTGIATSVRDNRTGGVTVVVGRLQECSLGYAAALLVYVVVASHKCASLYRGADRGRKMCISDEDRSKHLSLIKQILDEAIAGYGLPNDLASGVLASSAWPLRRLHVEHYSEVKGAIGAKAWAFRLEPRYFATHGGIDPEGLVRGSSHLSASGRSRSSVADLLIVSMDWGAADLATTLASLCGPPLGRVRLLLTRKTTNGDVSTLRRLDSGLIDFIGTKSSLYDESERTSLLDFWAPRSGLLAATSPRVALDVLRRFAVPTIAYLWNFQDVRSLASHADWRALHTCSALGRGSRASGEEDASSAPCLAVVASPLAAEAVLPRAGLLPPVARPLCLYSKQVVVDVPRPTALVVRQSASSLTWWLSYLARPDYPIAFRAFPPDMASGPPPALAAVLFPWSLWSSAFAELYAAELPVLVPSPDYLAELPCAASAVGSVASGIGTFVAPPVAAASWQSPGFARRTRCGSLRPALAVTQDWSATGRARMAVEFSELARWPGLVRFASLAELLAALLRLLEQPGARDGAVVAMRSFNDEAREEARRWWPQAVALLWEVGAAPSEEGGPASVPAPLSSSSSRELPVEQAVAGLRSPSPQAGACGFPAPSVLAAATPLRARHRATLGLLAQLSWPLRRAGLRYSLGFGTLLGAVRHGGLIPHESDLDVHVGWASAGSGAPDRRSRLGDLSSRKALLWLCLVLRDLVRRMPSGRHRFLVLCSGSRGARKAKLRFLDALADGEVPMCPNALSTFMDPWYDADSVGVYEEDAVAARLVARSPARGLACLPHQLDLYASPAVLDRYGPLCRCRWEGVAAWCLSGWDAYLRRHYGDDYMQPRPPRPEDAVACPGVDDAPPKADGVGRRRAPAQGPWVPRAQPVEQAAPERPGGPAKPSLPGTAAPGRPPGAIEPEELTVEAAQTAAPVAGLAAEQAAEPAAAAPEAAAAPAPSCWHGGFQPWLCCHPRFGAGGNADCWGPGFTAARCCDERTWRPEEAAAFQQVLQSDWARRCDGRRDIYGEGRPDLWMGGLFQELVFYFAYLRAGARSRVRRHALEFAAALDDSSPLDARLRGLLERDARGRAIDAPRRVRLLDVGSGPLSLLGYAWPGVDVELVAADPLACEYGEMRRDLGIQVPAMAAPRAVEAERLAEAFGGEAFDAVHCTNALDHSYDPVRGMAQMLRVVRRGRPVLLRHSRNEAEKNGYAGLHQWNLDVRGGRLVAWHPARQPGPGAGVGAGDAAPSQEPKEVDVEASLVTQGLLDPGALEVRIMDAPYAEVEGEAGPGKADWVEAVLWRRAAA